MINQIPDNKTKYLKQLEIGSNGISLWAEGFPFLRKAVFLHVTIKVFKGYIFTWVSLNNMQQQSTKEKVARAPLPVHPNVHREKEEITFIYTKISVL